MLKEQIALSPQKQVEADFDAAPVRERVVHLAARFGSPVLDVGTGACACMAVSLARQGLRVTAVDSASSAVRIAQERAAGNLSTLLDVRMGDASHLSFPDQSYRVVVAFDMLCHSSNPAAIVREMFRLSSAAVLITELNDTGRQVTHHHDQGFDNKLPGLLAGHCQDCQRYEDVHHTTYLCTTAAQ